jgi:uncharacterized protein YjiK
LPSSDPRFAHRADEARDRKAEDAPHPAEARDRGETPAREDKQAEKRRKKEAKQARDAERPLTSWERYRALVDSLEEGHELLEIADRKARFALVVMGALNVVLFLLATRPELVELIPRALRAWIGVYLVAYALVAVYFFLQAIEALRPRRFRPRLDHPGEGGHEHFPIGLRYHEDVVLRDLEAHRRAWREVRMGQLNAELAVQTHVMGRTNHDKYIALRRLYGGLRVMTVLGAGLVTVLAFSVFLNLPGELPKLKGGKPSRGGLNVLGKPVRMAESGVREPSGVVWHPGLERLFVVGDEGRIAELDREGRPIGERRIAGNLEDVVVHPNSGHLFLLAEIQSELILYDPVIREERRRWQLDRAGLLGEPPTAANQGFEGLAFREDTSRPGGGVLYLVHQRAPATVVAIAFDPARPEGELGADVVVERFSLPGYTDLTAATYVPALDRLLVIADARDRIVALRADGTVEAEVVLPGLQQEGLGLDAGGRLWVADDRGGLLRFDGALAALEESLRAGGGSAGGGARP